MADGNDRYVSKAKALVREKFPEMKGVKPSISVKRSQGKQLSARQLKSSNPRSGGRGAGGTSAPDKRYIVTFEREIALPGGGKMKRMVRVTMDEAGEVMRLTSSK
ncbi:MAG: hypothetical protein PVH41_12540 [Anaerolineae bacterium]|jgi:hypothetical protein